MKVIIHSADQIINLYSITLNTHISIQPKSYFMNLNSQKYYIIIQYNIVNSIWILETLLSGDKRVPKLKRFKDYVKLKLRVSTLYINNGSNDNEL